MTDPQHPYNFSLITHTDKLRIVGQDLYLQTGVSTDAEVAASSTFEDVQFRTVERFPDLIAGAIARLSDTQFTIVAADSADLVVGDSYQTPYAEEYYAVSELATVTLDAKSDPDAADSDNVTYTFTVAGGAPALADPLPHASACIVQTGTPDQLVVTKTLTLPPQNVDEAPHTLTLSGSHRVAENAEDAKVGDLGVTDAENDALRFHIASGGDGAEFEVRNASELYMALVPSHEAKATLSVTVVAEQVQRVIDAARGAADPAAFNTATAETVDQETYIAFLRGIVAVIPASFLDDDGRKAAAIAAAHVTDLAAFNALAEMSGADDLTQTEFDALVGGTATAHPANSTFGEAAARAKVVAKARETMTTSRNAFNGEKSTAVDEATYISFLHDDTLDLAAVPTAWRDAALKVSHAFDITVDDVNEAPATPTLGNAQVNALQTAFVGLLTSSDPDDSNTVAFAKDTAAAPTAPASATFADDAAFRQALIDAANAAEFNALGGMASATALTATEFATMQAGALNADAASFEVVQDGGFWKLRLTDAARTAQIGTLSTPLRVRVKAYDNATASLSSAYAPFVITVVHDSSAPFGLALSPLSVDEHDTANLTVGTLEAFNYEGSETLTFTLGADTASALFELDGAVSKTADVGYSATDDLPQKYRYTQTLKLKAALDHDEAASRAVVVTVADSAGESVGPTTFTVTVTNTLITPTSMSVNELAPGGTAGDLAYNGSPTGARFALENLTSVFEVAGIIASSSKVDSVTALVVGGAITSIEMQRKDKSAVWAGATEAERSAAKTLRASHERDFATAIVKAANGELTLPRSAQSDHFVSTTGTYSMLHLSGSATRIKALGAESAVVDGNALLRGGALETPTVTGTGPFTLAGGVKLAFDFFVMYDAAGAEQRLGEAASLELWRTQLGTKTGNIYVGFLPSADVYSQCRLQIANELLAAHPAVGGAARLFQADGTTAYSSDAATMAGELLTNAGVVHIQFDGNLTATAVVGTPAAAGIAPLSTTGPHVQVTGGASGTAFTRTYRNVWGATTPNTAAERFELFVNGATDSPAIVSYARTEDDGVVVTAASGSSIPAGDISSVSVREYLLPQTASNSITLVPYEFVKKVEYNVSGAALDYLKVTTNRDDALEIGTRPASPTLLESTDNMIIGFSAFPTLAATTASDQQQGARLRLLDSVQLRRAAAGAAASYDVRVKATVGGATRYEHITVAVTNVNESPTAIGITALTVSEGLANAVVGELSADDADVGIDAGEAFTFAIGTAGQNDNDNFEIVSGTTLRLKGTFSAVLGTTYTVDVVVSDADGATFARQLSIVAANYVNDAPTGIDLSLERHVLSDTPAFPIATLEAEDPDLADEVDAAAIDESHTFSVTDASLPYDVDNAQTPAVLRVKTAAGGASFDAASSSANVTLRVVDAAGAGFTMAAPITLTVVRRPQVASAAFAQTLEVQDVTLTLDVAPDGNTSFVSASLNGVDVVGSSIDGAVVTVPAVSLTIAGPNAFAVNLSYAQPNDAASTFAFAAEETVALNHVTVLQAELQAVEDALEDAGKTVAADDTGHDFATKITELKNRRLALIAELRKLELTDGEEITILDSADNDTIATALEGYFADEFELIDEISGVNVVGSVIDGAALAAAVNQKITDTITSTDTSSRQSERTAVKDALEQLAWVESVADDTSAAGLTAAITTALDAVENAFLGEINLHGVTVGISGDDVAERTLAAVAAIRQVLTAKDLSVRTEFKDALNGLHGISVDGSVPTAPAGATVIEFTAAGSGAPAADTIVGPWFIPSQANQDPWGRHTIVIRKDQTVNGTYYAGVTLWGTDYSDGGTAKQVAGFGSPAPTNGYRWTGTATLVVNGAEYPFAFDDGTPNWPDGAWLGTTTTSVDGTALPIPTAGDVVTIKDIGLTVAHDTTHSSSGRLSVRARSEGNGLYVVGRPEGSSSKEISRFAGKTFTNVVVDIVGTTTISVNGTVVATVPPYSVAGIYTLPTPLTFQATDTVVFTSEHATEGSVTIGPDRTLPMAVPGSAGAATKYVVGGESQGAITIARGSATTISYPAGHPLALSTTTDGTHGGGGEYTAGVVRDAGNNSLAVTLPADAPATLYYYCTAHPGMGGTVNITGSTVPTGAELQSAVETVFSDMRTNLASTLDAIVIKDASGANATPISVSLAANYDATALVAEMERVVEQARDAAETARRTELATHLHSGTALTIGEAAPNKVQLAEDIGNAIQVAKDVQRAALVVELQALDHVTSHLFTPEETAELADPLTTPERVAAIRAGKSEGNVRDAVSAALANAQAAGRSALATALAGGDYPIATPASTSDADVLAAVRTMVEAAETAAQGAHRTALIGALKQITANGTANPLNISASTTTLDAAALGVAITDALELTKTQLIGALQGLSVTAETFDAASSIQTLINAKRQSLGEMLVAAVPNLGIDPLTAPTDEELLAAINAALAAQRDALVDLLAPQTSPAITASAGAYAGLPATLHRGVAYTLTYPASHPLRLSETADGSGSSSPAEFTLAGATGWSGNISGTYVPYTNPAGKYPSDNYNGVWREAPIYFKDAFERVNGWNNPDGGFNGAYLYWAVREGETPRWEFGQDDPFTAEFNTPYIYAANGDKSSPLTVTSWVGVFAGYAGDVITLTAASSSGGGEYTAGVDASVAGTLSFTLPADAPDTLHFYCDAHSLTSYASLIHSLNANHAWQRVNIPNNTQSINSITLNIGSDEGIAWVMEVYDAINDTASMLGTFKFRDITPIATSQPVDVPLETDNRTVSTDFVFDVPFAREEFWFKVRTSDSVSASSSGVWGAHAANGGSGGGAQGQEVGLAHVVKSVASDMGAPAAVVDGLPAYPTIDTAAAKADAGMLTALRAAMEAAEDAAEAARLQALVDHINAQSAATGVTVTGTAADYANIEARLLAAFAAQRTDLLTRLHAAGVTVTAAATANLDALVTKIHLAFQGQRSALTGQLDSRIDLPTDIHNNAELAQAISDAFDEQRKDLLEHLIPDPSDPSKPGIPGFSIDVNSTNDADVFTAITAALTAKRTALIGETTPGSLTGLAAVLSLVPGVTVAADASDAQIQEAVRQALIQQRQGLVDALGALQRTYTAGGGQAITITTDPNAITANSAVVQQVEAALTSQRTRLAGILHDIDGVTVSADQHSNADLKARVEAAIGDSRVGLRDQLRVLTNGAVDIDDDEAGDADFAAVIQAALDTQRSGLVNALVNNIAFLDLAEITDQGDDNEVEDEVSEAIGEQLTNQQTALVAKINEAIAQLHPTITAIDTNTTPENLYIKLLAAFNANHAALVTAVHNVDGVQVLVDATGVPGLATAIELGYATQRDNLVGYLEQNVPGIVFTFADSDEKTKEEIGAAIGTLVDAHRTALIDALTHAQTGIPGFNAALAGGTDAAAIKGAIHTVMQNQRDDMVAAINDDATLSTLFNIGALQTGDADLISVLTAAFETRRNNLAGALNAALPGFYADTSAAATLDEELAIVATQALAEQDSRLRATLANAGITFASSTTTVVSAVQTALVELRREFAVKMDSISGVTINGLDASVGGAAPPALNLLHDMVRDAFETQRRSIVEALDDIDGINIAHNVVDPNTIALAAQTGLIALRSGVITALSALPQFNISTNGVSDLTRAEYEAYLVERAEAALQNSMDSLVDQLNHINTADGVTLTIDTVGSAPTLMQRYAAVRAAVEDALATQRSGLLQALQAGSVPGLVIDLAATGNADLLGAIGDAAANRRNTLSQALNAGVSGLDVAADVSDAALATAIRDLMAQQRSNLVSALNAIPNDLVAVSASGDAIVTEAVQTALNNERVAIANAVADADPHITMPSTSTPPSNAQIAQAVANGVARRRDLLAGALQGITNMPALGASGDIDEPVLVADAIIRDGVVQAIDYAEQSQRSGLVTLLNGITGINLSEPGATDATIVDAVKNYAKDFVDHLSKAKLTVKFATGSTVWDEDDTFLLQQYDADYVHPAGTFTFWPTLGTPVEKSTHADETGEQTVFVSFDVTLAPDKRVRLYNTNHGTWVNVQ